MEMELKGDYLVQKNLRYMDHFFIILTFHNYVKTSHQARLRMEVQMSKNHVPLQS